MFTEVFICKKIRIYGTACFEPQFFMRLPAILHCNRLNASSLQHLMAVNDIVEWLEREKPEQWDEPTYLEVHHSKVIQGEAELVEALKKAFLEAVQDPNPYTVRIDGLMDDPVYDEKHYNKRTKEKLTIKSAMPGSPYWNEYYISVERKHFD